MWLILLSAFRRLSLSLLITGILSIAVLSSCHTSHKGSGHSVRKSNKEALIGKLKVDENNKRGKNIVKEAMKWMGTPYRYASAEKGEGTDCSGMVMATYLEVTGIQLPRNSAKQAEFCTSIPADKVRVGDLCFFATGKDPKKISHVGIMIDDETFVHASTSKGVVTSKITTPYYIRTFIQFGRVPE